MAQEPGDPGAGVVGEGVAVLLVGETQGEDAGDLGLPRRVEDAPGAEGQVLGAADDADALGEAVREVRRGRGSVEKGLFGGGVVVGHGDT